MATAFPLPRFVSMVAIPALNLYWCTNHDSSPVLDIDGNVYKEYLTDHPEISTFLSQASYGVAQVEPIEIRVAFLDKTISSTLRASEFRGKLLTVSRRDLNDTSLSNISLRFSGTVTQVAFSSQGEFILNATAGQIDALEQSLPKFVVDSDHFTTASSQEFDQGATLPIVLGATREHIPCRYVEADLTNSRHGYFVCSDLSPTPDTLPVTRPYVNAAYRNYGAFPGLIGDGEFEQEWDSQIGEVTGLTVTQAGEVYYGGTSGQDYASTQYFSFDFTMPEMIANSTKRCAVFCLTFEDATSGDMAISGILCGIFRDVNRVSPIRYFDTTIIGSGAATTNNKTVMYYILNPDVGYGRLFVTTAGVVTSAVLTVTILDNVASQGTSGTQTATATTTITATTGANVSAGSMIIDSMNASAGTSVTRTTGTKQYENSAQGFVGAVGTEVFASGGSTRSATYTFTSGNAALQIAEFLRVGASGTLSGVQTYKVTAINGFGETTATYSGVASSNLSTVAWYLKWNAVSGASAYRIYRLNAGNYFLLTETSDTSFIDDGSITLTSTQLPVVNTTRLGALKIVFTLPQYGGGSSLVPLFADVEQTEMGPTANTKALWLFRNDLRDMSGNNNYLIRREHKAFYGFKDNSTSTVTDWTGNGFSLTGVAITSGNWVAGRFGQLSWKPLASGQRWYSTNAAFRRTATQSFRLEAYIRPDDNSSDKVMAIASQGYSITASTQNGWLLRLRHGLLEGVVASTSTRKVLTGISRLDGAWHHVALEVDRTFQQMRIYVDHVLEGTTDISTVGDLTNSSMRFAIGATDSSGTYNEPWKGKIDYVGYLTDDFATSQREWVVYTYGKSEQTYSAVDFTDGEAVGLFITDAKQTGLDMGTSNFNINAWVKLGTGCNTAGVIMKKGGTSTAGYELGVDSTKHAYMKVRIGSTNYQATISGTLTVGKWYLLTGQVTREAVGVPGSVYIYVNGSEDGTFSATTAITAGAPSSIDNSDTVFVGAQDQDGVNKFYGYLDELHVQTGLVTNDYLDDAYYSGMRNPARQVYNVIRSQQALQGAIEEGGGGVADLSWGSAERALDTLGIKSDYALIDALEARHHLNPILRLRGMRLYWNAGIVSSGWAINFDSSRSVSGTFGWRDGVFENMESRPEWFSTTFRDLTNTTQVGFRRRRGADGRPVVTLLTTKRTLNTYAQGNQQIEVAPLRDIASADLVADYINKRMIYADVGCRFTTRAKEAWDLSVGDLVTILDPSSGVASETHEIRSIREHCYEFAIETTRWNAAIFTYEPKLLPTDTSPESTLDYGGTFPPTVASINVSSLGTKNDVEVSWTAPTNYTQYDGAVVWFRTSKNNTVQESDDTLDNVFIYGGECAGGVTKVRFANSALTAGSWEFAVQTKNKVGLLSGFAIVTKSL